MAKHKKPGVKKPGVTRGAPFDEALPAPERKPGEPPDGPLKEALSAIADREFGPIPDEPPPPHHTPWLEHEAHAAPVPPSAGGPACPVCGHQWDGKCCKVDGYRGEP